MKVKLITGMFKMIICDLSVSDDTLILSSPETERLIPLCDIDSISISRHIDRNTRLEINLNNDVIEGIFVKKADADEFANCLKEYMGSVLQINFHG